MASRFTARLREHQWGLVLALGVSAGLSYLLARNAGLPPFIFGDELIYSTFSRLIPLADASVPSYLYLWLAGASSACGTGFLDCMRVANALLFAAAAPLIYLCARKVCGQPAALAVALASLLAPANAYTAYFMPEAPYYFCFALLAWTTMTHLHGAWLRLALFTGAILGLMSLIKVHALFLLPAQCLFVLIALGWRRGAPAAAVTALVALALRLVLGYLLAGEAALKPFGAMYGAHAEGSSLQLLALLPGALANLRGHLMGLALMFTFPFVLLCYALLRARAEKQPRALSDLQLYAVLMLAAPVAMAVAYTATIYSIEGFRVHMRYYDFAFPLLFIVGAAATAPRQSGVPRSQVLAGVLAAAGAAALLYAVANLQADFKVSYVDAAELATLLVSNPYLHALLALELFILAAWVVNVRVAACLFVFAMLPFFVLQAELSARAYFAQGARPTIYDDAGKFVRSYLSDAERGQLTIAGDGYTNLFRAKFHADVHSIKLIDMPENAAFTPDLAPSTGRWLLVVGEHPLPAQYKPSAQGPGYKLVHLTGQPRRLWQVNLSGAQPDLAMAERIEGFGISEQWGRWSLGKTVTIRFAQPLPRELVLTMTARAFGPNAGQPFTMRVGAQEATFMLDSGPRDVTLRFVTDGAQRDVTIVVPQPVSPHSLGGSIDRRTLGIGVNNIGIATPDNLRNPSQ